MHANSGVDPSHKNRWRISRPCANSHFNRERKNTILFFLACFSNCRSVFYLFNSMSSTSRRSIRIHIIITFTTNKKKYQHHQHMIRQLCQIQDVLLHFMCHLGWPFLWWSGMARMLMRRHHLRRNNDPSIKLHCTYASLKDESWPTRPNSSAQLVHVYNKITSVGSPTYLIGRPESYGKFPVFCQKIRICFQF